MTQITDLKDLFEAVQLNTILEDGKTFPDCFPKYGLAEINTKYQQQKSNSDFDLKKFVLENFDLPVTPQSNFETDTTKPVEEHINKLWDVLTRQPDQQSSSLIPLPYPYIVPGGRFREIYYWDSYFTMLGLQASGRIDMIENMVNNFSHLIDTVGNIPNGNRTYYIGRSQPPFYSLMVKLLAQEKGKGILIKYFPQLEKEYAFWMKGERFINKDTNASHHVVKMSNGSLLNRYWDENDTPRPESYREDVELAHHSSSNQNELYRHLRAGAESGWDFSCRWFKDVNDFSTIDTTEIIPVDLNCLLLHLEETLYEAYELSEDTAKQKLFQQKITERKTAIEHYCRNEAAGFYFDYDFIRAKQKTVYSLAAASPLFFKHTPPQHASALIKNLMKELLRDGGMVCTPNNSGQQWDAPNGWAPLQWMTIIGFENYGYHKEAKEIAQRWIKLNTDVFKRTGKLMEKYNVVDTHLEAGGGEYPGQDGFGWTNGVLLALIKRYGAQ
ncbi:MAG: alpha,alpha-trehalase TreF [Sphingobacteriales bacterium]|nr:alpha,alpha-trehalase TreF [Sphingobacteriales bacterium]MBI3718903.1 alpha,alpha-trehalase TreF [Sphingobacteriales bacterium]